MKNKIKKLCYILRQELKTSTFLITGFVISIFLISCLSIFLESKHHFQRDFDIFTNTQYEIHIQPLFKEEIMDKVEEYIEESFTISPIGIVKHDKKVFSGSPNKLFTVDKIIKRHEFLLLEGRYPRNEKEIIVHHEILEARNLSIGDSIILDITAIDNSIDQSKPESSNHHYQKEFTIVGDTLDSFYPFISFNSNIEKGVYDRLFIRLKKTSLEEELALLESIEETSASSFPDASIIKYDQFKYVGEDVLYMILYIISAVLCFMIFNIALLSLKAEKKHIGILKSLGMSNMQLLLRKIGKTLLYAFILIPIALAASYIFMHFYLAYANSIDRFPPIPVYYRLSLSINTLILIVVLSLLILLFTQCLPLISIYGKSIISLIKEQNKERIHHARQYPITEKLFGYESVIAKRNRKRSRSIYIMMSLSLVLCIILIITGQYKFNTVLMLEFKRSISMSALTLFLSIIFTVIIILNLLCLISYNIKNRKKENLILLSIGLEKKQLLKLLLFENSPVIIYSLIIGIILSLTLNYLDWNTYQIQYFNFPFITVIDWNVILLVITGYITITALIVYYHYHKLLHSNMISSIKE